MRIDCTNDLSQFWNKTITFQDKGIFLSTNSMDFNEVTGYFYISRNGYTTSFELNIDVTGRESQEAEDILYHFGAASGMDITETTFPAIYDNDVPDVHRGYRWFLNGASLEDEDPLENYDKEQPFIGIAYCPNSQYFIFNFLSEGFYRIIVYPDKINDLHEDEIYLTSSFKDSYYHLIDLHLSTARTDFMLENIEFKYLSCNNSEILIMKDFEHKNQFLLLDKNEKHINKMIESGNYHDRLATFYNYNLFVNKYENDELEITNLITLQKYNCQIISQWESTNEFRGRYKLMASGKEGLTGNRVVHEMGMDFNNEVFKYKGVNKNNEFAETTYSGEDGIFREIEGYYIMSGPINFGVGNTYWLFRAKSKSSNQLDLEILNNCNIVSYDRISLIKR